MQKKKKNPNQIVALCIISESELAKVFKDYSKDYETRSDFSSILYSLGIDTSRTVVRQDGLQHRNRLGEVVICSRYVGYERLDDEWINSGYASVEAKDKASGCRILEDIYRSKNLTEDRQDALEKRDTYTEIEEE